MELDEAGGCLWFEYLIGLARAAIPTETQVMVKREDEQAFARLLGRFNPVCLHAEQQRSVQLLPVETRQRLGCELAGLGGLTALFGDDSLYGRPYSK